MVGALTGYRNAEFATLLQTFREQFLPARKAVYSAWRKLAVQNNLQLVFLTQPHAYREDFQPYQDDLRLFPVVGSKKLNLIQAALLMDEINAQTREIAQGHKLIDTAACFAAFTSTGLFYDSVHYTLRGSRQSAVGSLLIA